ncbi:unnamed protein product [Moneuplotes crassus]|uniref:UDP-N-acetylglucosamine transferase subunit ALG14 n=1 Tax=Euplotes crassus TaxID=5936 RepID=A0AAD1XVY5_EUPCR|nr:unnamed protein product [Moneuplotes crassus]
MVVSNGPGTALPIIYIAFIIGKLLWNTKIIFIESFCRINSLSLTGRLVFKIVDRFYVYWEELQKAHPKSLLIKGNLSM